MKNNVIQFPEEKPPKESPFPGSDTFWIPEGKESTAMIVQCRQDLPEIRNEEAFLYLMAKRLSWWMEYAEETPKATARFMEEELELKGLLEIDLKWWKIAEGNLEEINNLIKSFPIKEKIFLMAGIARDSFPLKTVKKKKLLDVLQSESAADWTNSILWTTWNDY